MKRLSLLSLSITMALVASPSLLAAQAGPAGSSAEEVAEAEAPPLTISEGAILREGQVLVIASWACTYMQLERVNELGMRIVEEPLSRLVEQGQLAGWGQFNGGFRDEYNYHTFYLADSMEEYRRALGRVLNYVAGAGQADMQEFYQHCSRTREMNVRIVTSRP